MGPEIRHPQKNTCMLHEGLGRPSEPQGKPAADIGLKWKTGNKWINIHIFSIHFSVGVKKIVRKRTFQNYVYAYEKTGSDNLFLHNLSEELHVLDIFWW